MNKIILFIIIYLALTFSVVHAQSSWTEKVYFDSIGRRGAVGFSINGKGYIGTGSNTTGSKKDLWEYNPEDGTWTQKANMSGEARLYAVGFSIGNYGYIGTGDGSDYLNDLRQYDPILNQWIKKSKFPGDKRAVATSFSIDDKGYIGLGYGAQSDLKGDFYEYDPATDTWTQIADLPGADRSKATGFSIGSKGYVVFGSKSFSGATTDLWEYDQVTGEWTQKTSCPCMPRHGAVAFVIDEKAYTGTGIDDDFNYFNDFWQYDPLTDTWNEVDSMLGSPREAAIAFAIGDKGFVGTGWMGVGNFFDDFYEFNPAGCAAPTNLATTNIKATAAKVNWDVVSSAETYSVRYRKTGTIPWTKTTALSNFKKLTGLMPATQYDWTVKSVCDAVNNISSAWSDTKNFTTKALKLGNEGEEAASLEVFPNPFYSQATISFFIEKEGHTTLEAFDLAGRKIVLIDELLNVGKHEIILSKEQLVEGIYLVKLITGNKTYVIKVIVQ